MTAIGYALVGGNGTAIERVRHASRAEEAGFSFAILTDRAGTAHEGEPAPCVWGVLGAVAQATSAIRLGAVVDTPTGRETAELVARAATTAQDLMPGRFFLALAADEIAGADPSRTETAACLIRERWQADAGSATMGYLDIGERRMPRPARAPDADLRRGRRHLHGQAGGRVGWRADRHGRRSSRGRGIPGCGRPGPRIGRVAVCWAHTAGRGQDLAHGRAAAYGPDPAPHLAAIEATLAAGYDHVYLEQVGPDQAGFLRFAEGELLPALESDTLRLAS